VARVSRLPVERAAVASGHTVAFKRLRLSAFRVIFCDAAGAASADSASPSPPQTHKEREEKKKKKTPPPRTRHHDLPSPSARPASESGVFPLAVITYEDAADAPRVPEDRRSCLALDPAPSFVTASP